MPDARADRQRAREVQSGSTRAAVLGISDGLVRRNILWSAARQVLVLALAAGATWGAGRLFDVTVS